jgi:hypothetical protein
MEGEKMSMNSSGSVGSGGWEEVWEKEEKVLKEKSCSNKC